MASGELPADIRAFIRENISSIEQLEILSHLYNVSPRMETSESIAKALYLSPESTARQLKLFTDKHLIERDQSSRYGLANRDSAAGRQIGMLANCYRERRVSTINEVFSNPISTLQSFADAFILGKKRE